MLTVVCWKWRGWRDDYKSRHVNALQRMVSKHLHIPHRFVCVTGDPKQVECETVYPKDLGVKFWQYDPRCYRKLGMFSKTAKKVLGEKILSIDLDCVILDDITPLVTDDELKVMGASVCPYNTSLVLHKTGTRTRAWDDFNLAESPKLVRRHRERTGVPHVGSDQAWLAYRCPGAPTWVDTDGVYQFSWLEDGVVPNNARIVFFAGPVKPWSDRMRRECPKLYDTYMEAFSC